MAPSREMCGEHEARLDEHGKQITEIFSRVNGKRKGSHLSVLVTIAIAVAGGLVGYGKLQGEVAANRNEAIEARKVADTTMNDLKTAIERERVFREQVLQGIARIEARLDIRK